MKRFLSKMGVVSLTVVFAVVSFSVSVQAEKKKFSFTYTYKEPAISTCKLNPGDMSEHELALELLPAISTSSNPEWNDINPYSAAQISKISIYFWDDSPLSLENYAIMVKP